MTKAVISNNAQPKTEDVLLFKRNRLVIFYDFLLDNSVLFLIKTKTLAFNFLQI